MEKQTTGSPTRSHPISGNARYAPRTMRGTSSARDDRPSRDDITLCINIWAAVYRLRDADKGDISELQMPSRIWTGRSLPRIERFE